LGVVLREANTHSGGRITTNGAVTAAACHREAARLKRRR
jgi:hypothetical protein